MLVMSKKIFRWTNKFFEKNSKSSEKFPNEKIFGRTNKLSTEYFFVLEIFTNIRKKWKSAKRRFEYFIRNEDHSMPISRNTNVRVFPKTIEYVWPLI